MKKAIRSNLFTWKIERERDLRGRECQKTKVETRSRTFRDIRSARVFVSRDNNRIGNAKYVAYKRDACRLARVRPEEKGGKKKQRARRSRRRRKQRERERRSPETRRPLGNSVERVSESSPPSPSTTPSSRLGSKVAVARSFGWEKQREIRYDGHCKHFSQTRDERERNNTHTPT